MTLVAGALAAFVADDLRHAVGYLVIADAGLVLLGFAALDPAAWGPTRVWLVAMAASKTAVAAWSAVMEDRFSTRSVPDLRGWLRHSPIMGAALVVAAIATYGLPGWVAFEARGDLARLAAPDYAWLIVLAGLATLPTYVRLLLVGTGPATSRVRGAAPERFATRRATGDAAGQHRGRRRRRPPAASRARRSTLAANVNVPSRGLAARRHGDRGVPGPSGRPPDAAWRRIVRRDRTELHRGGRAGARDPGRAHVLGRARPGRRGERGGPDRPGAVLRLRPTPPGASTQRSISRS